MSEVNEEKPFVQNANRPGDFWRGFFVAVPIHLVSMLALYFLAFLSPIFGVLLVTIGLSQVGYFLPAWHFFKKRGVSADWLKGFQLTFWLVILLFAACVGWMVHFLENYRYLE